MTTVFWILVLVVAVVAIGIGLAVLNGVNGNEWP
jgi:hypothetical protein